MNNINIIGRLGRDPELKYLADGKAVAELNLAIDDGYGENKKTVWISCVLWGKSAEVASQYLNKGDRCGITGRLSQDTWDDKETGKKQTKTKITGDQLTFIEVKEKGSTPQPRPQQDSNKSLPPSQDFGDEDETPF